MTVPSIIIPGASALSGKANQETVVNGKGTYTVPAATAVDTPIGFIRFYKGMNLTLNSIGLVWDDLSDTGSTTLDVGFSYDDNTTYADDPNGFIDGLDATSAGNSATLAGTGIAFAGLENGAPEDGWVTVTVKDAVTSKAGNVTAMASFAYGNPPVATAPSLP